ncbi:MAG TPA: heavy-metal-associated domain-containing protein [Kribbella sp.]|uniref:heavy-metal-associated domain-containing protein n=1 Tax=Kribbella sp. TaxID=1871183 RepID=UPI002D78D31E|nr:heavy-metal-associated domain-containing protein [Kribbella sp.]HET6297024.1 heavy-metal-associated domain-containing protein [Kribbella sp.]
MSTQTFHVLGMTCAHCVGFVSDELDKLAGVTAVDVDLPTGLVTVTSERELLAAQLRGAVEGAGYELGRDGKSAVPPGA